MGTTKNIVKKYYFIRTNTEQVIRNPTSFWLIIKQARLILQHTTLGAEGFSKFAYFKFDFV